MAPPLVTKGGRTLPTKNKSTGKLPKIPRKPRVFKKGKLSSSRGTRSSHNAPALSTGRLLRTFKAAAMFEYSKGTPAPFEEKTEEKMKAKAIADRTQAGSSDDLEQGVSKEELEAAKMFAEHAGRKNVKQEDIEIARKFASMM